MCGFGSRRRNHPPLLKSELSLRRETARTPVLAVPAVMVWQYMQSTSECLNPYLEQVTGLELLIVYHKHRATPVLEHIFSNNHLPLANLFIYKLLPSWILHCVRYNINYRVIRAIVVLETHSLKYWELSRYLTWLLPL